MILKKKYSTKITTFRQTLINININLKRIIEIVHSFSKILTFLVKSYKKVIKKSTIIRFDHLLKMIFNNFFNKSLKKIKIYKKIVPILVIIHTQSVVILSRSLPKSDRFKYYYSQINHRKENFLEVS